MAGTMSSILMPSIVPSPNVTGTKPNGLAPFTFLKPATIISPPALSPASPISSWASNAANMILKPMVPSSSSVFTPAAGPTFQLRPNAAPSLLPDLQPVFSPAAVSPGPSFTIRPAVMPSTTLDIPKMPSIIPETMPQGAPAVMTTKQGQILSPFTLTKDLKAVTDSIIAHFKDSAGAIQKVEVPTASLPAVGSTVGQVAAKVPDAVAPANNEKLFLTLAAVGLGGYIIYRAGKRGRRN